MRQSIFGLLLLVFAAACRQAPDTPPIPAKPSSATAGGPVTLELDRAQYGAGDRVELTLRNAGDRPYGFNPCTRALEQVTDGGSQPVDEGDRICTMELWLVDAGATRTAATTLPTALPAGRYRMVVTLRPEQAAPADSAAGAPIAASAPFEVR